MNTTEISMSKYHSFINSFLFNIRSLRLYTEKVSPILKKPLKKKEFAESKKVKELILAVDYALNNPEE
ncbi:MAG: hypothetical protein J7559_21585, partial [Cohnella sp.]|nr:hypothetical protein [Cohnella sp.]